jgi:hypothetical protein
MPSLVISRESEEEEGEAEEAGEDYVTKNPIGVTLNHA